MDYFKLPGDDNTDLSTWQVRFLANRYRQIAQQIGHDYGLPISWQREVGEKLFAKNAEREIVKGKSMSDDHLKQEAVKLARGDEALKLLAEISAAKQRSLEAGRNSPEFMELIHRNAPLMRDGLFIVPSSID